MKEIIDKLDFTKIKKCCFMKDIVKRMKRQATDWEKILAKDNKGQLSKIYKEHLKFNSKKTHLIKIWAKDFNRYLNKQDI